VKIRNIIRNEGKLNLMSGFCLHNQAKKAFFQCDTKATGWMLLVLLLLLEKAYKTMTLQRSLRRHTHTHKERESESWLNEFLMALGSGSWI